MQWVTKNTTDPLVRWGTESRNYQYTKQVRNKIKKGEGEEERETLCMYKHRLTTANTLSMTCVDLLLKIMVGWTQEPFTLLQWTSKFAIMSDKLRALMSMSI